MLLGAAPSSVKATVIFRLLNLIRIERELNNAKEETGLSSEMERIVAVEGQ